MPSEPVCPRAFCKQPTDAIKETASETSEMVPLDIANSDREVYMPVSQSRYVQPCSRAGVSKMLDDPASFVPLTVEEIRQAFVAPAMPFPPILSLGEAASLVKLRPQTLKRKVSEGLYAASVVRGKPLRFWRDRFVGEVMS